MTIFTIYLLGWTLAFAVRRSRITRSDVLLTITWFAAASLTLMPIVNYPVKLSSATTLLLVSCHLAFVVGYRISGPGRRPNQGSYGGTIGMRSRWLAPFAAAFCAATLLGSVLDRSIPIFSSLLQIGQIRQSYLVGQTSLGLLGSIEQVLSYPAIAFGVLTPLFSRQRHKRYLALSVATLLLLIDNSFQFGARANLLFVGLATVAVYFACYEVKLHRLAILGLVGAALVTLMGSSFLVARSQGFANNPKSFLAFNCAGGSFGDWTENAGVSTQALSLSSCYFGSTFSYLEIFVEDGAFQHDPRLGTYNMSLLFRTEFTESRADLADHLEQRGLTTNPWASGVRDMWIDLRGAAFIGFAAIGYLLGASGGKPGRNEFSLIRAGLFTPWAVILPFISPMIIPSLVYPIVATWILEAVLRTPPTKSPKLGDLNSAAVLASDPTSRTRIPE